MHRKEHLHPSWCMCQLLNSQLEELEVKFIELTSLNVALL